MKGTCVYLLLTLAATAADRYALILSDPPVARQFAARAAMLSTESVGHRQTILASQARLHSVLAAKQLPIVGSTQLLLNSIFVEATEERVAELRALPGVSDVVRVRKHPFRPVRSYRPAEISTGMPPAAASDAGRGVKIAILDSGVDITHAAFDDAGYQPLEGYPRCSGFAPSACTAFTNRKVIVARSYVSQLAAGGAADDFTPRDHIGHGTAAAAVAAGTLVDTPFNTKMSGMAPAAYLGVYRIFGSPGVNDFTTDDVIIRAFEDAFADGMDIISFSVGSTPYSAPLARDCGAERNRTCDLVSTAVDQLTKHGVLVVAAAGNSGASGLDQVGEPLLTPSTIAAPANLASVLAVGAITNSRQYSASLVVGEQAMRFAAYFSIESNSFPTLTAPPLDVRRFGSEHLCSALEGKPLSGAIAIVARGDCTFREKAGHATAAGAVGVVLYQAGSDAFTSFISAGVQEVPVAIITAEDGQRLLGAIADGTAATITLDTSITENDFPFGNQIAEFSSRGPTFGEGLLKPDMVATGTAVLMPTQIQDPDGLMYNPTAFTMADGTSFATPLVAGAAAIVRHRHPTYSSTDIQSVLVNGSSPAILTEHGILNTIEAGAGKLDLEGTLALRVSVHPSSLSFGILQASAAFPMEKTLQIRNLSDSAQELTLSVNPLSEALVTRIEVSPKTLSLPAGAAATVKVSLIGSLPTPGNYDGWITLSSAGQGARIPYLFTLGDGQPYAMTSISGAGFAGKVAEKMPVGSLWFRIIDRYGVGVPGVPVTFVPLRQRGRIMEADRETNQWGIATATPTMPITPGPVTFLASANFGDFQYEYNGDAVGSPVLEKVVDAADGRPKPVPPGSLITIRGQALSSVPAQAPANRLPMSLNGVTASFSTSSGSWPGLIAHVSPTEMTVQIPWELQGASTADLTTGSSGIFSVRRAVQLNPAASPSIFTQLDDNGTSVADVMSGDQPAGYASRPVRTGETIRVYVNGLGQVRNAEDAASETVVIPSVVIGGLPANVLDSRRAPERAGQYRVTLVVPASTPAGLQAMMVSAAGVVSEPVKLHVH